ncbi:hypothetical protein DPQ22_08655 [Candidatus Tokpelaia sp.]|nr:hypothetical protein DPQ22_08655 [Candidatus Tokpelaia sp.]
MIVTQTACLIIAALYRRLAAVKIKGTTYGKNHFDKCGIQQNSNKNYKSEPVEKSSAADFRLFT